ncbi:unnamed protein product [Ambrosiozyma monospora]|uniref:Unnamed protein product n=1 Tax=Ambrosiozyma monospora TaxID=43982 RepID=A0ACB5T6W5_AMBMO|nr:unnamed protein product [Ambrosiozyma monospora]
MLQSFAELIQRKGHGKSGPKFNSSWVIGFLDGTVQDTLKPSKDDGGFFGHKSYSFKFEALVVPNGYIAHTSQAFRGSVHDSTILRKTGFLQRCEDYFSKVDDHDRYLRIYADKGYSNLHPRSMASFKLFKKEMVTQAIEEAPETGRVRRIVGVHHEPEVIAEAEHLDRSAYKPKHKVSENLVLRLNGVSVHWLKTDVM